MSSLMRRLAYDAAEPFERLSAQFIKKGALFMFGVLSLVVSLVFFTVALNEWLKSLAGTEIAALGIGLAYLSLGLALLVPLSSASRQSPDADHATPAPSPPKPEVETAAHAGLASEFSRQIDGVLVPICDVMRDAGLERERATLLAGAAIAKELNPLTGVAFALVAGFILGRTMRVGPKPNF
jgi:hypothetical protein